MKAKRVETYIEKSILHVLIFNADGTLHEHLVAKATDLDAVRLFLDSQTKLGVVQGQEEKTKP